MPAPKRPLLAQHWPRALHGCAENRLPIFECTVIYEKTKMTIITNLLQSGKENFSSSLKHVVKMEISGHQIRIVGAGRPGSDVYCAAEEVAVWDWV